MSNAPSFRPALAIAVLSLAGCVAQAESRWSGVERVVAFGDVHGAYAELVSALQAAGVIDAETNWSGGATHLISLGDLLDRGAESRVVMDLLRKLEDQAAAAGGRVHVVLGNHEVMNLSRDLNYLAEGEMAQYADLDPRGEGDARRGHLAAFAANGRYGSWLLERPLAVVINDTLFVHGGISSRVGDLSLATINRQGQAELRDYLAGHGALLAAGRVRPEDEIVAIVESARAVADDRSLDDALRDAAGRLVDATEGLAFAFDGPLWYRGSAQCHPYYEAAALADSLEELGAERLVVGHTPTMDGLVHSRMDGRVIRLDTGMNTAYYGGRPAALEIIADGAARPIYATDGPEKLIAEPNRMWARPDGMSDAEIETFLAGAEIIQLEELATGVTNPKRLTLEGNGKRLRAVFKSYDSDPNLQNGSWGRLADKADRFLYDLVAYRLDRMLGLEMVPPAVLREVDGVAGVVQYWIEDTLTEKEKREESMSYQGFCDLREQYNLMNVFDALIHNDDRNLSNVLYTLPDWRVWLIDHSRAFRSDRRIPRLYRDADMSLTPQLRQALEGLARERLQAELGAYLHRRQIDGIEARLKRLLRL